MTGIEDQAWEAMKAASGKTMGIPAQQYSMWQSSRYVVQNQIEGEIAEFGVWRGGMSMIAATALMQIGSNKKLHLFDTFAGMTMPTSEDFEILGGVTANQMLNNERRVDGKSNTWAFATLGDVRQNFNEIGFPLDRLNYVEGDVLNTVPKHLPERLAVCRIDTDWYESTKHIITHAWPRISDFGILLLDDYDVWSGSRKAIDEYFLEIDYQPLPIRIDSGRLIIKLPKK
jgi:O-methyltransferase